MQAQPDDDPAGQGTGPPPTHQGVPPPAASAALDAAQLQNFLMQAMQAMQQSAPQQPAAPAQEAQPRVATAPLPNWVQPAQNWAAANQAPTSATVPKSAASGAGSQLAEALTKVLGMPTSIVLPGALPPSSGAAVALTADPSGGYQLAAAPVDAALARMPPGADPVLALQACWLRAAEAAAAQPEAADALALVQARAARRAAQVLENDEDDLFYEGGKATSTLLAGVESGHVAPAFLDAMAASAATPADGALWSGILRDAFAALSSFSFARPEASEGALRRVDVLTSGPALRRCLAAALLAEAAGAQHGRRLRTGKDLEAVSLLTPLLAISSLPSYGSRSVLPLKFPAREAFMQLRNYPRNRGSQVESEISSIRRSLERVQGAAHEILKRVATLKPPAAAGREIVPAWLASAAAANLPRSLAGSYIDRVLHDAKATFHCSSDAFLVGALAVALRFCRPFLASAAKQESALAHLDPSFYSTQVHRLPGAAAERSLGGALPLTPAALPYPAVSPDRPDGEAPHYIAEVFFATQRLIRVGLVPAIYRCQALAKTLKRRRERDADEDDDEGMEEPAQGASEEEWLMADSMRAALLDPALASDVVRYCELTARWLLALLRRGAPGARAAFAAVPESAVRDLCAVLQFLIHQRAAELLGGADIGALVACLTGLLRATDLVPSPAVHYSVVSLLLAMLSPALAGGRRGRAMGASHMGAAEAALVSAVLGTGAAQTELLPALMAAYVHADHVVGLDVDKDSYDKFHMRNCVDLLLMELWRDPTCAASLDAVAAGGAAAGDLFPDFCGAVLNDLLYLLKDSLGRLADISELERSKADAAAWAAQPASERASKEAFYASQRRAAGGFMSQAVTTLRMLNVLAASRAVQAGFVEPRVVRRAAGAAVHFIDLLVGPRCAGLAVEDPGQYRFDPDALLLGVVHFTLRLAEQPAFVVAVAEAPDYDAGVMRAAVEALASRQIGEYEHRVRLEKLIAGAEARHAGLGTVTAGVAGEASAGALDLALPGADPGEGLEAAYSAALTPLAVGEFDSSAPRAYNRAFAAMAAAAAGDESKKVRRVGREVRDLRGKMALPVYAAGAVLVRHDSERLDKVRACVTGPEGTPYAGGCFFFDVYFPAEYPALPPLMELETTGGGVARFNPNLYADGKVCLSLLGTWHGGHESEKWSPATSTLWQVLLSIQGMIFIAEPYFNEPAYDGMRGTAEGSTASLRYNAELWLNTIRYAMVDVLRNPRPGFEEAIAQHFKLLRYRIMRQAGEWMSAAQELDASYQQRLRQAVGELHGLLCAL